MLAERGLTPHQFGVLMALAQEGESHQRRLSEIVGVDPRNAVAVIDALHQRRLLKRRTDPGDRRRHVIALTAQGRSIVDQLRGAGDVIERELLAGLSDDEQARLHALLLKLFDSRTSP
ncbi:MAG: MarR family winged helix-turn-helix transcriptional regulator [Solirubrobacteraceae bacterium]